MGISDAHEVFPKQWRCILRHDVPFYRVLDAATRERFEQKVRAFVQSKVFSGNGLAVTDRMKVTVAAAACRLTLNLPGEDYARLRYVTVHQRRFRERGMTVSGTGTAGKVDLVWPDLLAGLRRSDDGYNVGFHEFAHALDDADGTMDGRPRWCPPELYGVWIDELENGLTQLRAAVKYGWDGILGSYGASDEIEFFAVATETFFEKPRAMRKNYPDLYAMLANYYKQDPARCGSPSRT